MVIKTEFDKLDKSIQLIASMFNNKSIKEDAKNIIVWCNNGEVKLIGYSMQVACMTTLECSVDTEEEVFTGFKVKDLNEIMGVFRSLKKTYVSEIEITMSEETGYRIIVHEEPIDTEDEYADGYRKKSQFKINPVHVTDGRKKEISARMADSESDEWSELNVGKVGIYANTLLPVTGNDERGVNNFSNKINFYGGKAYAIPLTHGIIMNNVIEVLDNILFTSSAFSFMWNMIGNNGDIEEPVTISKVEDGELVLIKVKKGETIASIKTYNGTKCFKLKDVDIPDNGVVIDKEYMIDVIRRMSLTKGDVKFKVDCDNASFVIESDSMTQEVPIIKAKGEGVYEFSLSPQIISSMMLAHVQFFDNNVFMYLRKNAKGKIDMVITDSTKVAETGERVWYSYIENIACKGVATKW